MGRQQQAELIKLPPQELRVPLLPQPGGCVSRAASRHGQPSEHGQPSASFWRMASPSATLALQVGTPHPAANEHTWLLLPVYFRCPMHLHDVML